MSTTPPASEEHQLASPAQIKRRVIRILWALPPFLIVAGYCADLPYAGFHLQTLLLVSFGQIGYLCIYVGSRGFEATPMNRWIYVGLFFGLLYLLVHLGSWLFGIHQTGILY
jgi:hypothetical protein